MSVSITVVGCSAQEKEDWLRVIAMALEDTGVTDITIYVDESCFTSAELRERWVGWNIGRTIAVRPELIARPTRAYAVVLHEIGHVLGLKHTTKKGIMNAYSCWGSTQKGVFPTKRVRDKGVRGLYEGPGR